MSNLALVFSDLQAGEGSDSERLRANPAIPLQRWRVEQFYADLKTLYDRHGCKYLIDLGDTTDDRKSLPVPTIGAIMSGLNAIRPDPKLSIKLIASELRQENTWSLDCVHRIVFIGAVSSDAASVVPGGR